MAENILEGLLGIGMAILMVWASITAVNHESRCIAGHHYDFPRPTQEEEAERLRDVQKMLENIARRKIEMQMLLGKKVGI